jgi:hypothetical protein
MNVGGVVDLLGGDPVAPVNHVAQGLADLGFGGPPVQ